VLKLGGKYFMLCFSEKEPKVYGLRRISTAEIELTFTPLLNVIYIKNSTFDSGLGPRSIKAYLLLAIGSKLD
jgi:hypothetical protein